ncbi:hypothetical protein COLO4_27835 [Corchorus olitorius]|uniref:Uncharacterized protein n=1 Tax=Corchorus olitorius TaxID=93759 RepID=A0A1R3HNY4_9ROSI|nr:hypothetical protein COLO4_27835 [Corchorus olitorius]
MEDDNQLEMVNLAEWSALLQQQKRNHFQELNTDFDHVADKTCIGGQGFCFGDSDPTPGIEFSDIIIPTGR